MARLESSTSIPTSRQESVAMYRVFEMSAPPFRARLASASQTGTAGKKKFKKILTQGCARDETGNDLSVSKRWPSDSSVALKKMNSIFRRDESIASARLPQSGTRRAERVYGEMIFTMRPCPSPTPRSTMYSSPSTSCPNEEMCSMAPAPASELKTAVMDATLATTPS